MRVEDYDFRPIGYREQIVVEDGKVISVSIIDERDARLIKRATQIAENNGASFILDIDDIINFPSEQKSAIVTLRRPFTSLFEFLKRSNFNEERWTHVANCIDEIVKFNDMLHERYGFCLRIENIGVMNIGGKRTAAMAWLLAPFTSSVPIHRRDAFFVLYNLVVEWARFTGIDDPEREALNFMMGAANSALSQRFIDVAKICW